MREPGVAQSGREIERTDHLRHADAGLAGGARIAVCHVGGSLLAMHMQALDRGAAFHHREGLAQHGGHVKHVGDTVAFEHVGEAFGAGHFTIVAEHVYSSERDKRGSASGTLAYRILWPSMLSYIWLRRSVE